jgi:hypothetical protein
MAHAVIQNSQRANQPHIGLSKRTFLGKNDRRMSISSVRFYPTDGFLPVRADAGIFIFILFPLRMDTVKK